MKRRRFFKAVAAAPAVPALLAQQQQNNTPRPGGPVPADATTPPAPLNRTPAMSTELPKLETAVAEDVGESPAPKFFTAPQFAALKKLAGILMPSINDAPGALDARAPEFLDFLLSQSPAEKQSVYRAGLDALNAASRKKFSRTYGDLSDEQAATLLDPLKKPWTYEPPSDPLTRFLWAAKADVRTATMNSKEYAVAASAGRRGQAGVGLYWLPLD